MIEYFIAGAVIGALVFFVGAIFGYELGRASRASRPLLSVKRKPKEEETPKREYMDTRL